MSRPARSKTGRKRVRPGGVDTAINPSRTILIVGNRRRAIAVEHALSQLAIATSRLPDLDALGTAPNALAIVLVAPLKMGRSLADSIRRVRHNFEHGDQLPVFAVVGDRPLDRQVRRLYQVGATAVFEWPREGLLLPRLVAEALAIELVRGRTGKPDGALARSLRARLRLLPWDVSSVDLQAGHGTVYVSGKIPSLWHKVELEQFIANTPGVQDVRTDDLWVTPSGLSDHHIAGAVRAVLRSTSSIDDATLSVAVRSGYVVLAGSVADRRELDRILGVLVHVSGVRGIENATIVSQKQQQSDRTTVRRVRARLAAAFPDLHITASVFGTNVVLSGQVPRLSLKWEIDRLVRQDISVSHVINKLAVRS